MESSLNEDAPGAAAAPATSSTVSSVAVAAEKISCSAASAVNAPESTSAGQVLDASSDQVLADSSAPECIADVSNSAPSGAQPGDFNANGIASEPPKPKIRIKLKLSPKRDTEDSSGLAEAKTDTDPAEEADEEDWLCLKCINNNNHKRIRCWNCKGWKGGKRENFNPNKTKDDEGDPMEVDEDAETARAIEEHTASLDLRATDTASNDVEEESDDDMPMLSLKSKPDKNKKSKPTSSDNPSGSPPSAESSAPKPKAAAPAKPSSTEPKKSKKSHPKTGKLFSGSLRSAAAAHRNRQMHVPPIGSPGLLMLPNPSTVASFPLEDGTVDKKRKTTIDDVAHLLHNGYILPRTVYEQSMIAGGYTYEKRLNYPHRGSSTERTVDDMFDSDVSLYLHFPELIPLDVWERRLKRPEVESSDNVKAEITSEQDLAQFKTEEVLSQPSEMKEFKSEQPEDMKVDEEKGPRLVDAVIQSLSKLTGDAKNRNASVMSNESSSLNSENSAMPDAALSQPPLPTESSSGIRLTKMPQLNPSQPGTRKHSLPHQPMTFLDMIPISLASTYPPKYVEKRRAYAQAVMEREHLIIESQEATDDAIDNAEKYQAHKEAWDRMFEYQKQQIAKREAAAEEADRKAKEEAELKEKESSENDIDDSKPETDPSESKSDRESGDSGGANASETNVGVPKKRKKEDPMDYMPKPPEPPPPERFVTVPDIPIPPSPPSVLEVEHASVKPDEKAEDRLSTMHVPKVDQNLIRHLDPNCFLPTAEGRYFGLLSNYIADPLFVGPAAIGIRGITSGGGTGLATSYIGGGRGAAGLISGPLRGGMSSWQQSRETQSSTDKPAVTSSKPSSKKKEKKEPEEPPAKAKTDSDERANDAKPSPEKSEASSSTSKKRRPSETGGDEGGSSKKKVARVIPLATGDRNTLATEIASGPAGEEFPEGWTVKTYRRAGGETVGKTDRFWFSPGLNIRFRAKKHAMSFIEILEEPECNGDEQIAAETYRARGLHF